jgi:hypothetical protein
MDHGGSKAVPKATRPFDEEDRAPLRAPHPISISRLHLRDRTSPPLARRHIASMLLVQRRHGLAVRATRSGAAVVDVRPPSNAPFLGFSRRVADTKPAFEMFAVAEELALAACMQ